MNAGVIDEENKMFEKESHFIQDNIDQMIGIFEYTYKYRG